MSGRPLAWMFATFGAVTAHAQTSIALPGLTKLTLPHTLVPTDAIRRTAWVSEGQLSYLFDPALKDQKPSLPFQISSLALPAAH
jgi:hypothetical protein